ncbi:MAG TPA: EVE domain-containing protein [Gemmatales bacterium]|nr:EVE domain-containing protein [Gemmatales bacterium]HMP61371.1 EVE domain-containing protein [Gemmatales bacterium]
MARWLFKEEPSHYAFSDLERDGATVWDGVENALALKHLRSVEAGDEILFYHTGKEKAVVGIMTALDSAAAGPEGGVRVRVAPVQRLGRPVTLRELKAEPDLAGWELLRLPRLSIIPVTAAVWRRVLALSREKLPAALPSRLQRRKDSR